MTDFSARFSSRDDAAFERRMTKAMKNIARYCPLAAKAFLGKKFALPQYRAPDYYDQDRINALSLMMLMLPTMPDFVQDEVVQSQLLNLFQALAHDRPTLFLERELGEILIKTEIPGFLETSDIHFPFPSTRIMLPKGLLELGTQKRFIMYLDIGHLPLGAEASCPKEIAKELDRYALNADYSLSRMSFTYPDRALAISAQIDKGLASSYAMTKALKGTLEAFKVQKGQLRTDYPNDADDEVLLDQIERLALNILLILSMQPLEYEPLTIERKAKQEGKRLIPSLARAKWVGDCLVRAKKAGHVQGDLPEHGRRLPAHFVRAHWRNQPHGVGRALRRLIWILPYKTHGPSQA